MTNFSNGIRQARQNWRVRIFRLSVLFTLISVIGPTTLYAEKVDGYISAIGSSVDFYLGGMQIVLTNGTKCERNIALKLEVVPADNRFMHTSVRYAIRRYKGVSIACDLNQIAIGTRVHVIGEQQSKSQIVAERMIEYPIQPPTNLSGAALLEEAPELQSVQGVSSGKIFLDGYTLSITPQTRIALDQGGALQPGKSITPNMQITYQAASTRADSFMAASLTASKNQAQQSVVNCTDIAELNYSHGSSAEIQCGYGKGISIVPSETLQARITELGMQLIPRYLTLLPKSDKAKIQFRFYVVHSSAAVGKMRGLSINGTLPFNTSSWGANEYTYDSAALYDTSSNIIALPDGAILIPDCVLPRLHNKAELAALLSYTIASVLQNQINNASFAIESNSRYHILHLFEEMLNINKRTLRLGIRQMYLAGYDIREAPYAWAVAQGKPVNNPVIDSMNPDKEIPWYAAYAFNYISQYYKDADYSKLKRGEAEYAQFLEELRKADPEAFEVKK